MKVFSKMTLTPPFRASYGFSQGYYGFLNIVNNPQTKKINFYFTNTAVKCLLFSQQSELAKCPEQEEELM